MFLGRTAAHGLCLGSCQQPRPPPNPNWRRRFFFAFHTILSNFQFSGHMAEVEGAKVSHTVSVVVTVIVAVAIVVVPNLKLSKKT